MNLYPFQEMGVQWLRSREYALLADEMGLGKTVQAVVAASYLPAGRRLVVCPASLKYTWERAIEKWTGEKSIQVVSSSRDKIDPDAKWVIVNYDLLLYRDIFMGLYPLVFQLAVFDEAHFLKNADSKRTKLILLRGGLASRAIRKWFLTGTPILNRPVELYPLLKAAAPEVIKPFTSYYGYTKYYCGGFQDGLTWFDRGATHIEELNRKLTGSGFMLRRLKSEVLPDLPEKTYEVIPVKVEQKEEFKFLWQKDDVTKKNLGDYFNGDMDNLGALAAARQYIGLEKIKIVVPHIKALLLEKEKVVVFAHHREVVARLMESLGEFNPVKVVGGISAKEKDEAEQAFQQDPECRVFVGNIIAAGTGLTLTAADTCVFAELDWTPGNLIQASDRIHRIGQKNACLIQMFVTKDSIEEYMLRRLVEKKEVCEKVLATQDDIFS